MPGAVFFGDVTIDRPVLVDRIVRTDPCVRIAQPRDRRRSRLHASVMYQKNIGRPRTQIVIRRWTGNGVDHGGLADRASLLLVRRAAVNQYFALRRQ